ncbi:hypothetical protein BKA93DRAFT_821580 [Sparassis latifolia]
MPVAKGIYTARRQNGLFKQVKTLESLLADGFRLQKTPHVLLDQEEHIVAVLAGRPDDAGWDGVIDDATRLIADIGKACIFTDEQMYHRRGKFPALAMGVSYGGGQTAPGNLLHSKTNGMQLHHLLHSKSIQRVAGFGSIAFTYYAPKLFQNYAVHLGQLFNRHENLRWNFKNSIFPAATFNFSPKTVTLDHTDYNNIANGWCDIHAFGSFDHTCGGHLIL